MEDLQDILPIFKSECLESIQQIETEIEDYLDGSVEGINNAMRLAKLISGNASVVGIRECAS